MSSTDPAAKPNPSSGATLAPPSQISRPSSANSNSSRRGRSNGGKSGGTSRSNSHSSRGDGNSRVSSGNTTTIGGGVKLGSPVNRDDGKVGGNGTSETKNNNNQGQDRGKGKKAQNGGQQGRNQGKRPQPIDTGGVPPRSVSANSSRSESQPRVLHAHVSPPRTALDAALEVAHKKLLEKNGSGDALTSLQKMISDLKAISPSTAAAPSLPSASTSGRSMSMSQSQGDRSTSQSIPSSSGKKLKADAPSFQPSLSPNTANSALSPAGAFPPRAASFAAGTSERRTSSTSISASMSNYLSTGSGSFSAAGLAYQNPLAGLPETDSDGINPYGVDFAYQQQLLAAQYQQIQLLQAQIQANQIAQQQAQQQQQSQSAPFSAPRFQALAAQRIQQQQEQQARLHQAHEQAQHMYQTQALQVLQQANEAQGNLGQSAANAPPVFEEDSPEQKPVPLATNGRPQLNPNFTFGAKRQQEAARESMSPPANAPVINRSEGIGGAAATGLAGLAARAHKRTGSEVTPAMQEQLDIQSQIEALQARQKALNETDRSTVLNQLSEAIHKRTSSVGHRRAPSSSQVPAEQIETLTEDVASQPRQVIRGFGDMGPPPVPTASHARKQSNAVTKGHRQSTYGSAFGSMSSEIPEDGFPGPSHQRSGSRSGFESGNWRNVAQGPVTDLASAQAQLQSLAQFRAAAGGGHEKMASFAFPNMMPNILAATTLQTPAGQSLIEQQQAFQLQLQQNAHGPQRKSLFAPYLPQASLPPLLQAGKLVVGFLRVNKKNRSDAYVATDVLDADIYICGSKDRNRALEGDIVAIELLDVDEVWGTKKEKEEKKKRKEENAAYDLKPATVKKLEKKKDDVEVEGQGLTLFDDEEVDDDTKPKYAGHVVAVVERMPGQLFSGQLGVLRPSSAATKEKQEIERREREGDRGTRRDEPETKPRIVWFKPTDKRVPLIAIPTEQAPTDFIDNPDAYSERLFVATIKRWPITSLHPFGTLVEELGPIGDAEVETSALLKDCNFPTEEFNELAIKCLPPLPWSIPEREFESRDDLRADRVFTIDPATAKDLDDALDIKKAEDGTFKVRVHIADVSYFVKTNTALDREARKRATSVYLVQRAVPMLPPQLSEELCSLVPGAERLTFTVTFTLDAEANVQSYEFKRSIIKSCAQLSYGDVQNVIDGSKLDVKVDGDHQSSEVEEDIKNLRSLASKLRARRVAAGAMLSKKLKVKFSLDDKKRPIDCEPYETKEANHLVEEFMLLANLHVSQVIANGLPEQALLRRHEAPLERRLDGFVKRAGKLGFEMDPSSTIALQKSFDKVEDPNAALCLELLKRKSMQSYFCTGMLDIAKYSHWALNVPLYTHFTSPIRRYADVLVHRMLDACITSPNPNEVKFHMDRDQVAKCAQQCNMKKQSAKLAEEQSIHLHLCMLIHDLTERYGPVVREGRVTGVLDAAFDIFIPEFGIEKRVHVDKMPLSNTVFDEHKDILALYWTKKDTISFLAETSDDPHTHRIKTLYDRRITGTLTTQTTDKEALFSSGASAESSKQYLKSSSGDVDIPFEGLRKAGQHQIQDIKELMSVPVIITSDMSKSPPVLVVYACNPYAN